MKQSILTATITVRAANGRTERTMTAIMEYKVSKGFLEDIANFARFCDENDTDSMEIEFTLHDGRKAIAEMTFRTEEGDDNG